MPTEKGFIIGTGTPQESEYPVRFRSLYTP